MMGRSRTRRPVAWYTALPIAAAVPVMPISPMPLAPIGQVGVGDADLDLGHEALRRDGRRLGLRHVGIPFVLLTVVPRYPGRPALHLDFT